MKKTKIYLALLLIITILPINSLGVFAAKYSDVPEWAASSIERVDKEGIMVGTSDGKFNSNSKITKFDLVDVLANMAGYKDPLVTTNMTDTEKNYIKNAYQANKWLIEYCESRHSIWKSSANEKIAFLLQKNIIEQTDLNSFVVKKNGKEQYGYLTKEEISKYLACLMGFQDIALTMKTKTNFYDDSLINDAYKPYVTVMKDKGLVSGSNNRFNPQSEITRVILAVFINNVLEYQDKNGKPIDYSTFTQVQGEVVDIYDYSAMKAIRLNESNNNSTLYKITKDAKIFDGDKQKAFTNLSDIISEGDNITVYIDDNNSIVKIDLKDNGSNSNYVNNDNKNQNANIPSNGQETRDDVSGVVASIRNTSNGKTITLKVQYVTWGKIEEREKTYIVRNDALFVQNGENIDIDEIEKGSAIEAIVDTNFLYSAEVRNKYHNVEGTVVDKSSIDNKHVIVVELADGSEVQYQFTPNTRIKKKGTLYPDVQDIKIGNYVSLEAEFDKINTITTETDLNTLKGTIQKIEISKNPKLTIRTEDGLTEDLYLSYDAELEENKRTIDIYSLRLGYKVDLELDGKEIYKLKLKNTYNKTTYEGTIDKVKDNGETIILKAKADDSQFGQYEVRTFNISVSTKIYKDSVRFSKSSIREGMKVIVTLKDPGNSTPATIFIVEE